MQRLVCGFRQLLVDQVDGWRLWLGLWTPAQTSSLLELTKIPHVLPLTDRRSLSTALDRLTSILAKGARLLWRKREQLAHEWSERETKQRERIVAAQVRAEQKRVSYAKFLEDRANGAALGEIRRQNEKAAKEKRKQDLMEATRDTSVPQPGTMTSFYTAAPSTGQAPIPKLKDRPDYGKLCPETLQDVVESEWEEASDNGTQGSISAESLASEEELADLELGTVKLETPNMVKLRQRLDRYYFLFWRAVHLGWQYPAEWKLWATRKGANELIRVMQGKTQRMTETWQGSLLRRDYRRHIYALESRIKELKQQIKELNRVSVNPKRRLAMYAAAWKRATELKVNKMIGIRSWQVLASRVGSEHCEQTWEADAERRDREVRLLEMQTRRMMSWVAM